MHYVRVSSLCLNLFLLFVIQSVNGQNKLDSVQLLQEVVVTEKFIPKDIIPVQTLTGKELEKLNAHSVADALRYFSGVQLKDYGGVGGLKTINVRSMGSEHVGVFYDGIEIGNAQNGIVDLGRFSLENMEMLSLYNGQKSAIFQAAKDYASASALYMQAKEPSFKKDKKHNINLVYKTGSFDLVNPSILWEQQLSPAISSSLNVDYTNSSGKYKFRYKVVNKEDDRGGFDTTEVRKNGDIEYLRLEQSLFGKIKGGDWKTKLYYYHSERGVPGAIVRETPGRYSNEDRLWDRNFFFQTSLKKRPSRRYSTQLLAKYAYDYMHYLSDPEKDEQVVIKVDNKYHLQEAYISSANLFNILPFWNVNLSVDYQWNKLDANLEDFSYPDRHSLWIAAATSLYFDHIKIQGSLLSSIFDETFTENIIDPFTGLRTGKEKVTKNWDKYTPSLIVSYKPFIAQDFHLRSFYKKIFRLPTFNEVYYAIIGSGKSALRPEYTTQYDIGATYSKNFNGSLLKNVEGQVDVYYNEVIDKIVAVPTVSLQRWSMMNLGLVKIKGIDVTSALTITPYHDCTVTGRFSYTYQEALDYSDPEEPLTYKNQIPYIPKHSGSAILSGEYLQWELNYSFIYSGERYSSSANIPINKVLAWYTNDIALSRQFNWRDNRYKVTMEVNNLFNQRYEVVSRYPMPGTNFKFIFRANF
ncbi:TonB-dependent receptor plug domain-containing protein [Proteiniphilum sp. UBA5384]|uniref:TonB-dependent receptor plug domain-containing protein n=1 Tax=Proteiniphilum sp. UBA5384 TaxID=1947279 RepID=UPI0025F490DC|nr:TonB-dependent receptor plug domain-containing protein [Proteiniphilum sp. UBA5384]